MKLARTLAFVLSFLSTAFADVEFINPTTGTVIRAGDVITVHWRDSGALPRMTELVQYDLYLCAGGDTPESYEDVALLAKNAAFSRGNSVSLRIDPDVGGNDENAYFLRMVASGPEASVVNYSDRFTLTNMTGSFSPLIIHGIHSALHSPGSSANEGEEHEELRKRQMVGSYTIPYPLQTGPTRYAPMAKKPGSTIPAGSPTPQFSASPYTIATTYLPAATVQVTLSASETYSVVSIENTASPAPRSQDMQMKRFLERWKD
ncbi:putative beta-1,6-glucan biosynthesis protein (Knh1) [Aspergillus ibericus CBS 121593]|uniref:Beta-1,6-glucan biosynthesis protein n=1 Tax=Aspergillus ibericus CBS 121593 TaxID=1448316 RepID=A0A395HIZ9_9EURO|nr:beta-1,6-glucan biosynthesis protein [Aspergillus ibericus CBS 121593]RAL06234.1 beta-1,6-glucan biosynthesis protein [Aspergillus ibericus CBS 121593]